ncbi:MAG: DUF4190 domain-containing protein [Acidimicrobiia bacterium]
MSEDETPGIGPFGSNEPPESTPVSPFGQNPNNVQPQNPIAPPPPPQIGTYYSNQNGFNVSGPKNDPFAVTAISVGIPSIVFAFCCGIIGLILGIIGIVFGILSLGRIKKSNGMFLGKGLAITGISCGSVGIVIFILLIVIQLAIGGFNFLNY